MKISNKNKAILFLITSAFFFTLMNMFVRLSGDLPTVQKMFFRNLIAAIIAFIILIKNKQSFLPKSKKNIMTLSLRSLAGLLGVFCNFYAVDKLVLSDASILNKMSPFFAVIFSFLLLKERPKFFQLIAVFVAFVGAIFVIKPSFYNTSLVPAVVGFIGGACAGLAYTFVRKATLNGEHSAYVVFFFSAVSTIVILPFLIFDYHAMSFYQLCMLLFAGFSAAGGQFMITLAYKNAPSKEVSVYDFSQVIFAAIIGFFVFEQIPDLYSFIGYFIIVMTAVLNFMYTNKLLLFKKKKT